jgi:hypothetical protein
MPGDRPHRYPNAPILTCLPAADHFLLRPQLLTRASAPIGTAVSTVHMAEGLPAIVPDVVFLRSPATGHDADTLAAPHPHVGDEAEQFLPQQPQWEVILLSTVWVWGRFYGKISLS